MSEGLTPTATAAKKVADLEEKVLANGREMTRQEQLVQARRHATWGAAWARTILTRVNPDDSDRVAAAMRQLSRAASFLEKEISE